MNASAIRRLWVLICLVLLGGLTSSVPVTCMCLESQHMGIAIHPIFPHSHPDEARELDGQTTATSSQMPSLSGHQGSLLVPVGDSALFQPLVSGITLFLMIIGTLRQPRALTSDGPRRAPPTAPPRLSPQLI
jgi:hypothetical protein